MPNFISDCDITPDWIALAGPILASLSVPLTPSPKSLARLDNICKNIVVHRANDVISQFNISCCQAIPAPVITHETARGSVRKRNAENHDLSFMLIKMVTFY